MLTQKGQRRWLFHSDRKGQKRWLRASPKESRHRGWGLTPYIGLTLRVAGRPTAQVCSAVEPWARVLRKCQGQAQRWHNTGWGWATWLWTPTAGHLRKLDLMVGSEGLGAHKSTDEALPRPGRESHGALGSEGTPSSGLPLSWLPGTAKPVIQAQLGLLMNSVPSTTHWITDSGRIKTSVPSYDFHLWFRRHFKIPQSHGVTVSRSPILLVRP